MSDESKPWKLEDWERHIELADVAIAAAHAANKTNDAAILISGQTSLFVGREVCRRLDTILAELQKR